MGRGMRKDRKYETAPSRRVKEMTRYAKLSPTLSRGASDIVYIVSE